MNIKHQNKLTIKTIEISKFRSLKNFKCDLSEISVFVGLNDVGKSNILKALNLFFNGEVEPGKKLNFSEDFNYDGHINKKADEICIKLTFSLPKNYWNKNGKELVWEKKWRLDGEFRYASEDKYFYGLDEKYNKKTIGGKANVRALINRITYIYIPAVRDANYFDNLRFLIYKTMTKIAENSLLKASNTFEQFMVEPLKELVNDTKVQLGENVVMSFPKNLANIFEKLDFLAGDKKISLNKRGDGIKNRYIPLILNFIAKNEKTLAGKGTAPYTFLWGYEEPENNLEIQSCIDLCNEFVKYIYTNNISQILLTTHSPVFYNIKDKIETKSSAEVYHIYKNDKRETCLNNTDLSNINQEMGTAALMSEQYKHLEKQLIQEKNRKVELENIIRKQNSSCLYVEGTTDKKIIEKLLKIYGLNPISVMCLGKNGGYNYVSDMLKAFDLSAKFREKKLRAAGLVDEDAKSYSAAHNTNKNSKNYTKCFVLQPSSKVKEWKAHNEYIVNSCLESYFPESIWEQANKKGWLTKKENNQIINERTKEIIINQAENISDRLKNLPLFITHEVKRIHKGKFTDLMLKENDTVIENTFEDFKDQLFEIYEYLST